MTRLLLFWAMLTGAILGWLVWVLLLAYGPGVQAYWAWIAAGAHR